METCNGDMMRCWQAAIDVWCLLAYLKQYGIYFSLSL